MHRHSSNRRDVGETTALLGEARVVPAVAPAKAVEVSAGGAAKKGYNSTGNGGDGSFSSSVASGSVTDEETAAAAVTGSDDRIPKAQVFWLCVARLVEPIAFFSIFPYISEMVKHNGGLADADVGFYNGLIESAFSLTQAAVMISWGRLADRARVFSWFAFFGNLGIFLGSLMGGVLVDPARQYGGFFGRVAFLRDHPYALPSFGVGLFSAFACVTTALFVNETLPPDDSDALASNDDGTVESETRKKAAAAAAAEKARQESVWQLLNEPGVSRVLLNFGWLFFVASGYTVIIPLWWFTPVRLGGFGFSPLQISVMTAFSGIVQAVWLIVVFPPLQHRYGTNGVMRLCAAAYPLFFTVAPVANTLLRRDMEPAFWAFFPPTLALSSGVAMAFTASQLAINEVSPSPRVLGTLTAFSLMLVSIARSICPALFTTLFAIGAKTQVLGGYAIWLLLFMLAIGFWAVTGVLPDYDELKRQRLERERAEADDDADGGAAAIRG
ncbi:hypothetical protein MAPG_03370 [Magnaporthiopsis poae ATCC 64411]|uniref:Major facilitator superfamily (MFS) profile domain-containing protein n=1 Tax=Magnaporthiopsis poae (strain ATCC 64411 / 73-15) TaxID=644358 RepID=A0A0C4DTU4_MAGP6|nr:hypothetical protein MAPG_03370 [Magnaporthiopsis poae ATCC 64411]